MTKQFRLRVAAAIIGITPPSFVIQLWLFFSYFDSHPNVPHPELGLLHPLNNHGSYVFISKAESTSLALLMYVFLIALCLMIVVVPKEFQLPPPGTPRWITKISARFKTGLETPSTELSIIFCCSAAISTALILFVGPTIVNYLVARGVILHL